MTDTSRPLHELLRERAAALSADAATPADGNGNEVAE